MVSGSYIHQTYGSFKIERASDIPGDIKICLTNAIPGLLEYNASRNAILCADMIEYLDFIFWLSDTQDYVEEAVKFGDFSTVRQFAYGLKDGDFFTPVALLRHINVFQHVVSHMPSKVGMRDGREQKLYKQGRAIFGHFEMLMADIIITLAKLAYTD